MGNLHIAPVFPQDLPAVAEFVLRQRASEPHGAPLPQAHPEESAGIERRLRWLLLDSPTARPGEPFGYCLRDGTGAMRGLDLCFPAAFRRGEERLLGLGSGSFFVDAEARSLGFYLFRKYLGSPGYAFFFATTCNAASAPLWRELGGAPVRRSEIEYVIPLKLDSIIALGIANRTPSRIATEIARFGGRCAGALVSMATRPAAPLAVSPCRDWAKLAELSRRHSRGDMIASDRSESQLEWRYGPASPAQPCEVYLMQDSRGNEGWFAMSQGAERTHGKLQACILLDAIWPRDTMAFGDVVHAVTQAASGSAEALVIRCRPDFDWGASWRWLLRRRLAVPRSYVIAANGAPHIAPDLLDYDDNDYLAWS